MFEAIGLAVLSGLGRRYTHPGRWIHPPFRGHWPYRLRSNNGSCSRKNDWQLSIYPRRRIPAFIPHGGIKASLCVCAPIFLFRLCFNLISTNIYQIHVLSNVDQFLSLYFTGLIITLIFNFSSDSNHGNIKPRLPYAMLCLLPGMRPRASTFRGRMDCICAGLMWRISCCVARQSVLSTLSRVTRR